MRELINCTTANPNQSVRPLMQEMKKPIELKRLHQKRSGSTPHLPCSAHVMDRISKLITGDSVLSQLNERFTLMNNLRVSLLIS